MWNKLMSFYKTIITPAELNGWASNILVAIPRIIAKKIQAVKYLSKNESFLPGKLLLF